MTDMADDITHTRASLSSVDARVARLEQAQSDTDGKIGLIQLEQSHLRELMTSRFNAIEGALGAQSQKLDTFITRIDTMVLEATRSSGDLTSSAAGRGVHERLVRLETANEVHESVLDQARGMAVAMRWVIGASGLALVAAIVSIAQSFAVQAP